MPEVIRYEDCPACKSRNIELVLEARDYTVSDAIFSIWQCKNCTLRFTQNVPQAGEIGRYYQSSDYISHSDTSKGIINKLYHSVRNITLQQKRKLVQNATGLPKGTLLDIGAGTGAFAHAMKEKNWTVTALEPDETARTNAQKSYGLQLQLPDELYAQQPESFDAVTLWHVLEHVHELHRYLDTFQQVLKKNGVLIIAVPNYTSYDADYYKEFWAAYDVPRHLYHFSPSGMKTLLAQHGFVITSLKPMPFDAFYVSMLSEKYKNGKNNYAKAVVTGLQSNIKAFGKPEKSSSVIYLAKKV